MQNEKEQEMMSPANPTEATPSSQRDLVHSLETLDTEFNSRPIGKYSLLPVAAVFLFLLLLLVCFVFSINHFIPLFSRVVVSWDSSCAFFVFCFVCLLEVKRSTQGVIDS